MAEQRFSKSAEDLKKALILNPKNIRGYVDLARAYLAMRHNDAAEAALQMALGIDPDSIEARVSLGDYFMLYEAPSPSATPEEIERGLRAQGIWFQLLSVAEQNAGMRRRRQTETERGMDQVRGTFAQVMTDGAKAGGNADRIRKLIAGLRVRPVITAHPTEAKRVTVLEKHRRIYRRLVDLESPAGPRGNAPR